MSHAYLPPFTKNLTSIAVELAIKSCNLIIPEGWRLISAVGACTLRWNNELGVHPPPAYVLFGNKEYSLRDHALGFFGEARPIGALAEIGTGLFFLASKILRLVSFQKDAGTFGDTHLIASYAYTELRAAVELLEQIVKEPLQAERDRLKRPSLLIARKLISCNKAYREIVELTNGKASSGIGRELFYLRCKLSSHRGLSRTATLQLKPGVALEKVQTISVAQLEGLGVGAFTSDVLFGQLALATGWLLELAQELAALGEFVIIPEDSSQSVIVALSKIDALESQSISQIFYVTYRGISLKPIVTFRPHYEKPKGWAVEAPVLFSNKGDSLPPSTVRRKAHDLLVDFFVTNDSFPKEGYSPITSHQHQVSFGQQITENTLASSREQSG